MNAWSQAALPEVLDFREGPGILAKDFVEEGVPLVRLAGLKRGACLLSGCNHLRPEDVAKRWSQFQLQEGDVLLSTSASLGEVATVGPEGVGAVPYTGIIRFRPRDERLDPAFIPHLLTTHTFKNQITAMGVGSVMKHFGPTHLKYMSVAFPQVEEQRAIAEVLGALDDKIAANRSVEATSDELVRAMYAHSVRDDAEERPLFDVFHVDFGEAFKGTHFTEPGVGRPLIRIRDLKTFRSQVWTTEQRTRETLVRPGDVVVGMDAEFRATWWLGDDGLLNQRVCRVRGRDSTPALVAEALRAPLAQIERSKSATTVIHLNKRDLEQAKVSMPTNANLRFFEVKAQPLVDLRVSLARQRVRLAQMRDALLPLLMSGKVTVNDAEKVVEGVA